MSRYLRGSVGFRVAAALLMLAGAPAAAQSQDSSSDAALDLLGAFQLATENDRLFSAAGNEFAAVRETLRQAKGLYYPTLSLGLEHVETTQTIKRSDNEVFGSGESDFPTDVISLSLRQPIYRSDFINERKRAGAEVQQAEYQFMAAEQELMLRTAEAYLLVLAAQDNERVARAELEAVGQQLKLAEKRLEVGMAHPTEVHESRARFELNQAEIIQAENTVADRLEALRVITGSNPSSLRPLREEFPMSPPDPADPEMWVTQALTSNLAVLAREAALEVALAEHGTRKSGRYPTVDLVVNHNNRDTGGSLFGGGSEVDTTDISVRANWTIFQGGTLRSRIREAGHRVSVAQDELDHQRANVRRQARNAYLGVVSSIARANALESSITAQRETVDAKQKGFETGANSNLEVLDAKRDLYFVERDYLEARYDYLLSLLDLKRQTGSLAPEDMTMINAMLGGGG